MLPFVPAGHATNPEGLEELIFDPSGTTLHPVDPLPEFTEPVGQSLQVH